MHMGTHMLTPTYAHSDMRTTYHNKIMQIEETAAQLDEKLSIEQERAAECQFFSKSCRWRRQLRSWIIIIGEVEH